MTQSCAGKGHRMRRVDKEKYNRNFDAIFKRKTAEAKQEAKRVKRGR